MTREELIKAIEAASGPSRELDREVAFAVGWKRSPYSGDWVAPNGDPRNAPSYFTGSVDAALSLVPEGRVWSVGCIVKGPGYVAVLDNDGRSHRGATPALALCAAALRAMKP